MGGSKKTEKEEQKSQQQERWRQKKARVLKIYINYQLLALLCVNNVSYYYAGGALPFDDTCI